MKSIHVPAQCTLIDPSTGNPATETPNGPIATRTFRQWIVAYVLNDERARGKDIAETGRLFSVILPAFADAETVTLEDADYVRLVPIVKEPKPILGVLYDAQLAPFAEAFLKAESP